jgi:methionyl aminopeptidase
MAIMETTLTLEVGEVAPETKKLLKITKESLYKGIEQCVRGKRVGDISFAIKIIAKKKVMEW